MVNAFQKRGVHADSFRPWYEGGSGRMTVKTHLLRRDADEISLRARFWDGRLSEWEHENVLWQNSFFLDTCCQDKAKGARADIPEGAK